MDRFDFFFAFYGLILGLAVTELLGGFAAFVRARAVRKINAETALLAILCFLVICATWIDAWRTLQTVDLDFQNLWAPTLIATSYYLAATVVFPSDPADYDQLADYYAHRKRFVAAMLLIAEFGMTYTYLPLFERAMVERPDLYWYYMLPYNLLLKAALIALMVVKSRRANLFWLTALILLFFVPYWESGLVLGLLGISAPAQ